MNVPRSNLNTSHVTVQRGQAPDAPQNLTDLNTSHVTVQRHTLSAVRLGTSHLNTSHVTAPALTSYIFKYISCYGSTHHYYPSINHTIYLNTSHVTVQQNYVKKEAALFADLNTSHVTVQRHYRL